MTGVVTLVLRLLLDARLASSLVGGPWLERVCERESRCPVGLVGVHTIDQHHERTLGEGWSTRGPHGMMARFALDGWPAWVPPWVIDVPLASAIVATRRARHWRCGQVRACRAWRGPTYR